MDAETFQKVKSDFSKKKAYEIDPLYGVGDANLKAAQETCGQTCAPAPSEYRPQDVQKQIIQSLLVNKDNADDPSVRGRVCKSLKRILSSLTSSNLLGLGRYRFTKHKGR